MGAAGGNGGAAAPEPNFGAGGTGTPGLPGVPFHATHAREEREFWQLYDEVLYHRFRYKDDQHAALPLLPLYRTIADALALYPHDPNSLIPDSTALAGLIRARRREDTLRLYRYANSQNAYLRHTALDALCKLFNIPLERPLLSYPSSDPLMDKREQEMQEAVREALTRAGLLTPPA